VWAAGYRRERALAPAAASFEAAVPNRIRGDERFQRALEDAETAESLQDAVALHEGEIKGWAAKGVVLLRAVETADRAYQVELCQALNAYRDSITAGNGENDADGMPH
jgi:hypothetical protein